MEHIGDILDRVLAGILAEQDGSAAQVAVRDPHGVGPSGPVGAVGVPEHPGGMEAGHAASSFRARRYRSTY